MNLQVLEAVGKVSIGVSALIGSSAVLPPGVITDFIVPVNVWIACAAGAYSSFSFGEPVEPRSKMLQLFVACIIMGAAWTALVNWGISFATDGSTSIVGGAQAGLGAVISCLARFFIPEIIKRIGPWLDKIPFLRKRQGE